MISSVKSILLKDLTSGQKNAVKSKKRQVLVVAGAGSGKTEVMARRIAWWVGVEKVPKDKVVAFTFTEKAAKEMKYRIRDWIQKITPENEEVNLRGMYVGTIHGFCLTKLKEYWPDEYHNYDVLPEESRRALILRGYNNILAMSRLRDTYGGKPPSQSALIGQFVLAYDQLHENNCFDISLPRAAPPHTLSREEEMEWSNQATLLTDVGQEDDAVSAAFAVSAARYYAFLKCRRFLDFSTSQTEFVKKLKEDTTIKKKLENICLVVDEVQDINPIQSEIMDVLVGASGRLTAVGDHRQSIYGFRGAKVSIIATRWNEFIEDSGSEVIDLKENFRSTPRIINIANKWSDSISPVQGMTTPHMLHGKQDRKDIYSSHVALATFSSRDKEASWIAKSIRDIVPSDKKGAKHDCRGGAFRGLALSDIAVLVRSSTDVRTYMQALEAEGIPSVVRAGPDLFSQPEILLFIAALAKSAGIEEFYGNPQNTRTLSGRINHVLKCEAKPEQVIRKSAEQIRKAGLIFASEDESRLLQAAFALEKRIVGNTPQSSRDVQVLRTRELKEFLTRKDVLRRVFPQQLYHWLLTEAGVEKWDTGKGRGEAAMFHLGTLSSLITGLESPGWTSVSDYEWQVKGLCQFGAEEGRTPEQPLMVNPDAVTISTIHSAKGLEFAAVFLADVCSRRFPSQNAKRKQKVPLSGAILKQIDIAGLSDNENYDDERRLMYVGLTRAERFLFVSCSVRGKRSLFIDELEEIFKESEGEVADTPEFLLKDIEHAPLEHRNDDHISTSYSDLRYFLRCPHDFYLRKVLGFSPTIDQAFGYGRGVHNLLREVHANSKHWAALASAQLKLEHAIKGLIKKGLFYLRYTTGQPAKNMHEKGSRIVADYIKQFADELSNLSFEPEKEFETLVTLPGDNGAALISGAIDVVRHDNPPRVTLIDFKSGDSESDKGQAMDEEEMSLQIGVYAAAARKELEYEPRKGLVRYLDADYEAGQKSELEIPLHPKAIEEAQAKVVRMVTEIRARQFRRGPQKKVIQGESLCTKCDFNGFCGLKNTMK